MAPFPHLDAAALGKTYEAIADFYDLKQADFVDPPAEDTKVKTERDAELSALVQSGNFNKLYSKFLLEKRIILETPERAEDVHGAWKEYLPGDEKALAQAADGTPWCVASPTVGRNYLESGLPSNRAKFILFHLQDPETGQIAENACASIRLSANGRVAEISGLESGQALEDALISTVEEKVRSLPGGEKFLRALVDKQRLIAMDRKMQAGEYDFSSEDIDFIFEQSRKIEHLDAYTVDPRITELRCYILEDEHFVERFPEGLNKDLNLNFSAITKLPEGLSVGGDLKLRNNDLLSSRKRNIIVVEAKPMDYMTLKQAGEKWNISPRQINYYCSDGRIPGAEKIGRVWLIPKDAEKPKDKRRREIKESAR